MSESAQYEDRLGQQGAVPGSQRNAVEAVIPIVAFALDRCP